MGEARTKERQRRAAIDEAILVHSESWARPASDLEAALYAEVAAIPHEQALAPPREALLSAGMRYAECHINCASWTQTYRSSKHIIGWWQMGDAYILHSVIEASGELFCVTPQREHIAAGAIAFVHDAKLQWVQVSGVPCFQRDGHVVWGGLRKYPERFKRAHELLLEGVSKGLSPSEALAAANAEIGPL